jgi:hypothetical protein
MCSQSNPSFKNAMGPKAHRLFRTTSLSGQQKEHDPSRPMLWRLRSVKSLSPETHGLTRRLLHLCNSRLEALKMAQRRHNETTGCWMRDET